MTLFDVLPAPIHSKSPDYNKKNEEFEINQDVDIINDNNSSVKANNESDDNKVDSNIKFKSSSKSLIPPYGSRNGWVPRKESDFADGGAFPEIHVAQYPPGFTKNNKTTSNALVRTFDSQGNIKYDALLRGNNESNKIIYANPTNMLEKQVSLNSAKLDTQEEIEETTNATSVALERALNQKIANTLKTIQASNANNAHDEPEYIRYTPFFGIPEQKATTRQRIIKMVKEQVDPLMPNSFNINKKVPRGPPSPPAPILHSPPRKLSNKEASDWKIPPCISNWKNPRGYTIPLHMRVAADGRDLEGNDKINENFAKISESLYIAESNARKAVEYRASMERKKKQKEKEKQEEKLLRLAEQARRDKAELRDVNYLQDHNNDNEDDYDDKNYENDEDIDQNKSKRRIKKYNINICNNDNDNNRYYSDKNDIDNIDGNKTNDNNMKNVRKSSQSDTITRRIIDEEIAERNEIRQERARQRQRDRNIQNAAPEKRSKLQRERERSISEKIAIGLPVTSKESRSIYDERLFNQSKGIDSGFNDEDEFNAYDKPWNVDKNIGRAIYHPSKNIDEDIYGYDLEKMANKKKFVPDVPFSGTNAKSDSSTSRNGPVQFEEDPFGLDEFFQEVKEGKKRNQ